MYEKSNKLKIMKKTKCKDCVKMMRDIRDEITSNFTFTINKHDLIKSFKINEERNKNEKNY